MTSIVVSVDSVPKIPSPPARREELPRLQRRRYRRADPAGEIGTAARARPTSRRAPASTSGRRDER